MTQINWLEKALRKYWWCITMNRQYSAEEVLQCPYDASHKVPRDRFQRHYRECQRSHPEIILLSCPFDRSHRVPVAELDVSFKFVFIISLLKHLKHNFWYRLMFVHVQLVPFSINAISINQWKAVPTENDENWIDMTTIFLFSWIDQFWIQIFAKTNEITNFSASAISI